MTDAQDAIDMERERLIAGLSALIYWAHARGDLEDARRWGEIREDLLGGKVGEWCFFVETQEHAA